MAGSIEGAGKANSALAPLFPVIILLTLSVIIIQVRSSSARSAGLDRSGAYIAPL
jgi:hypothetical protein